MLGILLRLLGGILIVVLLNQVIDRLVDVPWSWGSDRIHKKRLFLLADTTRINTLFIGDSKIGQSLIPEEFDLHVARHSSSPIRSFNFGVGSMMPPESYHTLENLLFRDSLDISYVFIELSGIPLLGNKILHTVRSRYWQTPRSYLFTMHALMFSEEPIALILGKIKSHTIAFLERVFMIGFAKNYLLFRQMKLFEYEDSLKDRGYYCLEWSKSTEIYQERLKFLQDPSPLEDLRDWSLKTKFSPDPARSNPIHLRKIQELIEKADSRGIHLFFVLPPHIGRRGKLLAPLFYEIPNDHRIELCDAVKYPELYEQEHLFEGKHMNHPGALLFTRLLAEKFLQWRDSLETRPSQKAGLIRNSTTKKN